MMMADIPDGPLRRRERSKCATHQMACDGYDNDDGDAGECDADQDVETSPGKLPFEEALRMQFGEVKFFNEVTDSDETTCLVAGLTGELSDLIRFQTEEYWFSFEEGRVILHHRPVKEEVLRQRASRRERLYLCGMFSVSCAVTVGFLALHFDRYSRMLWS